MCPVPDLQSTVWDTGVQTVSYNSVTLDDFPTFEGFRMFNAVKG